MPKWTVYYTELSKTTDVIIIVCHIRVILHRDPSVVEFVGELGEKDKMRGTGEHLIIFTKKFNKFNQHAQPCKTVHII